MVGRGELGIVGQACATAEELSEHTCRLRPARSFGNQTGPEDAPHTGFVRSSVTLVILYPDDSDAHTLAVDPSLDCGGVDYAGEPQVDRCRASGRCSSRRYTLRRNR